MEKQEVIGLSLSFCVASICRGEVLLENVQKIVTSTKCSSVADWEELMKSYQRAYWWGLTHKAVEVAKILYSQGKIVQPRLKDPNHFPFLGNKMIWVSSEEEIQWQDEQ